ncbi:MAG: hypothetical protein ACRD4K_01230 [Candidatus Acidiferrales bacterium]
MEHLTPIVVLTLSLAALSQFGLYLWRAAVLSVAAESLSADESTTILLNNKDFKSLTAIHDICPQFGRPGLKLHLVQAYYQAVQGISNLCSMRLPSVREWAAVEMSVCTRAAAVLVDQRMRSTQACYAQVSSF